MMPNPWIILALVIAWIVSLGVVGKWQNTAGHTAERTAWMEKENKELTSANAEIMRLESEARLKEHAHAEAVNEVAATYQGEINASDAKIAGLVAAVRDGAIRLSDPGARPESACSGGSAKTPASAGGGNGKAGAELSGQAAEFLLGEAGRADKVVKQLTACQAILLDDRR